MFCPICKSKDTAFFAKKDIYTFFRCSHCKSIFLKKIPSDSELNLFYSKQFIYSPGLSNELLIKKRSQVILKKFQNIFPTAKTLCDVGSGYGFFLNEANKKGYETIGIEPSEKLASYAEKNFNISQYKGELKKYIATHPKQFDIVTCIHVIEHVRNPKEFISLLFQLVKPGGILYLETPNSDSHLLYVEKEQYTFLIPPEHLWLLSQYSIKKMLPKDASIEHIYTYSYPEHFMGIIKRLVKGPKEKVVNSNENTTNQQVKIKQMSVKKQLSFLFFDKFFAQHFVGMLNLYHKGSILELYIKKKYDKSGL